MWEYYSTCPSFWGEETNKMSFLRPRLKFLGFISIISTIWIVVTLTIRNPMTLVASPCGDKTRADDILGKGNIERSTRIPTKLDPKKEQLVWSVLTKIDSLVKAKKPSFSVELKVSPMDYLNGSTSPSRPTASSLKFTGQLKTKLRSLKVMRTTRKMKPQPEFVPALTLAERAILFDLTVKFSVMCKLLNITYFMYGGTLLGSYRHHDLIPWDDDIDLLVDRLSRDKLYNSLNTLPDDYHVMNAGIRLKFFSKKSKRTSKYPWKWPYIDISFFNQNSTHIWDSSWEFSDCIYPKNIVFPLHERPLGDIYLNSPKDAFLNLKKTYKNVDCSTHFYSHKLEASARKRMSIPCKSLENVVKFVHRTPAEGGIRETLMLGPKRLHSLVVKEPKYALTKPYRLELI